MKKRVLSLAAMLLCFVAAWAEDFTVDGIKYNITSTNDLTVEVARGGEYSGEIVIPASVQYEGKMYSVTSIGVFAFRDCSGLTSITIPNSVTSIGDAAFWGCSGLTSITIPNSVTSIGDFAFRDCSGLTSITIPNSVTSIGDQAFFGCSGLTSITIPNSVTSIGDFVFYGCSGLTSITIPNGVTRIGGHAFYDCSGLTSITIPNGVTSIGGETFCGCSSLTSITIPNSVTSIGSDAFYGCGLTSITIPNSVTSIGDRAFFGCGGLTSITIPNSVTSIRGETFFGCGSLTSITIPNSVTSIGDNAFYGTAWLGNQSDGVVYAGKVAYCYKGDMPENTSIILDEGTTGIAGRAFSGCKGLTSITIPNSVTSIGGMAFSDCGSLTSIVVETGNTVYDSREGCNAIIKTDDNELIAGCKNTVIPNSVTSIGGDAFRDCSGLTSVSIPNSVTSIGNDAFNECSGLTSVTVQRGTPVAINNYVFSNRTNATLYVPTGCVAAYQAADYWKEFGRIEELFTGTLTDEQGVKYTANADGATCTVSGHEEGYDAVIIIPKVFQGRTVSSISDNAFKGCSNLTSVNIPSSVTSIGNNAFDACVNLTNVGVCIDSPIEIDNSVFSNKANATLYVPANSVAAYQTADNWKEFSVIEAFFTGTMRDEQGMRYTSNYDGTCTVLGFDDNYNVSIAILAIPKLFRGKSVTSIGNYAFHGCRSLTSITIPNSVTSIGYDAFEDCSGLTSITIPNCVTSIGDFVFYGCSGLTSITIPNSVTSIGLCAFQYCSGLTSITIPNSVTSIGHDVFRYCSGLTSIVVEAGNAVYDSREGCNAIIKTRDNELMTGCKNTIIPSSVTSIQGGAFEYCGGLTSITIPNSVTSIGDAAFLGCSGLTSINIPNSVTSIGGSAFKNCSGLTSVTVQRGTPVAINNDVFSNRTNATLYVPTGCVVAYQAADHWKEFGRIEELFTGTLTDEQGVRYTANADGATCTVSGYEEGYDTSIIIPKVFQGRTVSSISDNAFKGCSNLTSVNIPSSVTSIGNNAFDACVNLTNVGVCVDSPIEIDNSVFSNKANATLYVPANSVAAYQTADNWKEFSVIEAFFTGTMTDDQGVRYTASSDGTCTVSGYDDNYNASIAIPKMFRGKSVTSIGRAAFEGCSLISITIPNSVTSIEIGAFYGCSGLTSITIPNSVTSIEIGAFYGCSGLTSITIPNSVTSIGSSAFSRCNSLTSITIPNSVTSIGWRAFYGCSGLTSITIPHSVTSIGSSAFEDCSGLTSVTVQRGTPIAIDSPTFTNRTNATLYVPVGSKALYEAADYWKEFKEIVEVEGMMDASILDNALYADDVTVYPDGATCFPILMKSEESITNIQFDVVLPEGVTIKNSTLTDRKGSDHTITTSSVDGATRFIVTSMGGQVFSDNDGAVVNLSLDIDKNLAPGHREITLRNVTLSTTGAVKVNTPVCIAEIIVSDIKSGDADGDGVTDVNDVTSTINHILKKPVASFVRGAADVDGDSVIDVNDVQATIDKALGKTASSRGTDRQEETEPALDPQ